MAYFHCMYPLSIYYKTSALVFFSIQHSEHRKAFEKVLPISKPSKVQILGVIVSQDKKWWRERANQSRE